MLSSTMNKVQYTLTDPFPAEFAITFKYWAKSEIAAVLSFAAAADQVLVQDTDYSLTDPGDTGTLTRITAWTGAIRLTIYRTVSLTQATDLRNGEAIDADVLEADTDRGVARAQQLDEKMERAITVPITDVPGSFELPTVAQRANKYLACDADGDVIPAENPGAYPATPYMATLLDDVDEEAAQKTLNLIPAGASSAISTFIQEVLQAADVLATQKVLGLIPAGASAAVSAFVQSLLDDPDASAARSTMDVYSKAESDALTEAHLEKALSLDETVAAADVILQRGSSRVKHRTTSSQTASTAGADHQQGVVWLTDTLLVRAFGPGTGNVFFIAGTVAADGSISWGSAVDSSLALTNGERTRMARLTDSLFVAFFRSGTDLYAIAGTVSGTTVTLGSGVSVDTSTGCGEIARVADDKFAVIWKDTGSTNYLKARAGTVAGTTITLGAEAATSIPVTAVGLTAMGTDECIAGWVEETTHDVQLARFTLSGTVVTWDAVGIGKVDGGTVVNPYFVRVLSFDSDTAVVLWTVVGDNDYGEQLFGELVTRHGSTFRCTYTHVGSPLYRHVMNNLTGMDASLHGGRGIVASAYNVDVTGGFVGAFVTDGRTLRFGEPVLLEEMQSDPFGNGGGTIAVRNGRFALCMMGPDANKYPMVWIGEVPSVVGIAQEAGSSVAVCLKGYCSGLSGLSPGLRYYAHPFGGLTTGRVLEEAEVGLAISATEIVR